MFYEGSKQGTGIKQTKNQGEDCIRQNDEADLL